MLLFFPDLSFTQMWCSELLMLRFRVRAIGAPLQVSLDQGRGKPRPEFLTMQCGFAA